MNNLLDFYRDKKVLITGHTGFKGSWMCKVLEIAGAKTTGYGLEPPTSPNLFELCGTGGKIESVISDIRDIEHLKDVFARVKPEIVIHMAAQPLVRESYNNPVSTYETNVMGTVNLLECVRLSSCVKSVVNVTTDKVYRNKEWEWGYRENEELNGYDPYSNSKSCSELVTSSYKNSFFKEREVAITTCRAGNVIGGGDFAADRIIPDCVKAAMENRTIEIRNPFSTRPYQHVLEPVLTYLLIAKEQYINASCSGNYNIGPEEIDCCTTGELVEIFCDEWKRQTGISLNYICKSVEGPHEANFLKLDCSKIKKTFSWKPMWNIKTAIEKTIEWTLNYQNGNNVTECMEKQIKEYLFDESIGRG